MGSLSRPIRQYPLRRRRRHHRRILQFLLRSHPGSGAAKILGDAEKMFVDTVGMALLDRDLSASVLT